MGFIKCIHCPARGNFEIGRYYAYSYGEVTQLREKRDIYVKDKEEKEIKFSLHEFFRCFKSIEYSNISVSIYIDRKKEFLFVPNFKHEIGYDTSLDIFYRLSPPYIEEDIGEMFRKVLEENQNHDIVTEKQVKEVTSFFKIVMNGKGWISFTSGRWMIGATFVLSEDEVILSYMYKKKGSSYGLNKDDREIERIVSMSLSNQEIGNSILDIFKEAKII